MISQPPILIVSSAPEWATVYRLIELKARGNIRSLAVRKIKAKEKTADHCCLAPILLKLGENIFQNFGIFHRPNQQFFIIASSKHLAKLIVFNLFWRILADFVYSKNLFFSVSFSLSLGLISFFVLLRRASSFALLHFVNIHCRFGLRCVSRLMSHTKRNTKRP